MTLTTHMVVGAAAAKVFSANPVEGFIIGWLSHYILDSIIHWDYPLSSIDIGDEGLLQYSKSKPRTFKMLATDVSKVLLDVIIGFSIVFIFLRQGVSLGTTRSGAGTISLLGANSNLFLTLFAAAIGACIPDFLQFVFITWKTKPVEFFQKFHNFMHHEEDLSERPVLGVSIQLALIALVIFLFNY